MKIYLIFMTFNEYTKFICKYTINGFFICNFVILGGLTVQCSKGYNSGSIWNFQKILSGSERCIFPYGNLLFGAIAARGSEGDNVPVSLYALTYNLINAYDICLLKEEFKF